MSEQINTPNHSDVICLYHANCFDGLLAAAIAHHRFKGAGEYIAVRYQEEPPLEKMKDKHVYLLDFTYPTEVLLQHVNTFRSLTVIDHHEDAVKPWLPYDWADNVHGIDNVSVMFDNRESGATLTWSAFNPPNAAMPELVEYAREYDIWTKRLPMTDEVQSAMRSRFQPHKAQFESLMNFVLTADGRTIHMLQEEGKVILEPERNIARGLIKRHLQFLDLWGYQNVAVCMMPAELVNLAGEMIYTEYPDTPFVAMYEDNLVKMTRKYSFRSRRDGGANVSKVAAILGGKGHYNSAGAMIHHPPDYIDHPSFHKDSP